MIECKAAIDHITGLNTKVLEAIVKYKKSKKEPVDILNALIEEAEALKVTTDNGLNAAKNAKTKFQNFVAAVDS